MYLGASESFDVCAQCTQDLVRDGITQVGSEYVPGGVIRIAPHLKGSL
jgi:hypothetical protein